MRVNSDLLRPAEVNSLLADASKARRELGWKPRTSFSELVQIMVDAEVERLREEKPPRGR